MKWTKNTPLKREFICREGTCYWDIKIQVKASSSRLWGVPSTSVNLQWRVSNITMWFDSLIQMKNIIVIQSLEMATLSWGCDYNYSCRKNYDDKIGTNDNLKSLNPMRDLWYHNNNYFIIYLQVIILEIRIIY